ncbi:Protease III precursor [Raoultella ornithinolytica]|nr:Protease III precursor [Raoultella ornithinolytica]
MSRAMPRKVLRVEFRIDNNSEQFRSKTDELVTYMIGNRSPGTLSDWLQQQGLVEGIRGGFRSGGQPATAACWRFRRP